MRHGERLNGYSHLAGAALALPAFGLLLQRTRADAADPATVAGVLVFGLSVLLLYLASAAFHGSRGRFRRCCERVDHCAIYGLIAGTYTPFALALLHGAWAWLAVGAAWSLAATGMALECRRGSPSLPGYVATGWLAVIAAAPIVARLPGASLAWLLAGAVFYTVGIVFYRNALGLRHAHGAWHLFVLAGTACHYLSVAELVDTLGR